MARLQNHPGAAESFVKNLPLDLKPVLARWAKAAAYVGTKLVWLLGCLFSAEIRLGRWFVAPDQVAGRRRRVVTDEAAKSMFEMHSAHPGIPPLPTLRRPIFGSTASNWSAARGSFFCDGTSGQSRVQNRNQNCKPSRLRANPRQNRAKPGETQNIHPNRRRWRLF